MPSGRYVTARQRLQLLLFLALTLPGMAFASVAHAGTQLLPALAGSGKIEIENLDRIPYNDRLVFQRMNTGTSLPAHKQVFLLIKNTGASPLTVTSLVISGSDAASFTLPAGDADGIEPIAPGSSYKVPVDFRAGGKGNIKGIRQATLLINSSDPDMPTLPVELVGFNMVTDGGTNEPDLQEILDTFGYRSIILNPGEGQTLKPIARDPTTGEYVGGIYAVGDEVLSPTWTRAEATKPVYVRQLAALSGGGSVSIRVSGSGGSSVAHDEKQYQSFLPMKKGDLAAPTEMTINPTSSAFDVVISGYNSNRSADQIPAVRFWPVRDRSGALVPNSYIVTQDYVGNSVTNFDYQDNVYLMTNMRPTRAGADPNKAAPQPGAANLVLEFDNTNYPGTLGDKDGKRTGFLDTQRNKKDSSKPQNGPTDSYDASKLTLNTGGQGTLTIKSSAGSNAGTDNTLVNGLCTPFDGRSGTFIVSTRLVGPLNTFTTAQQQAGVMFGPNQGNFLKLTAGVQVAGAEPGKPWIQFTQELSNTTSQIGSLLSIPSPQAVATLDLVLTADAATGKVEASYRINDGIPVKLPQSVTLTGTTYARFFDLQTKGCLLTLHKGASEVSAVFDRFAIAPAPPEVDLPTVNAGPDQQVPLNAQVTLSGRATDINGTALTGNWEQVSGTPQMVLSGSGNSQTFTAPSSYRVLTFAFAASDSQGRSASDTVKITVGDEPISGLSLSSNTPVELGSPTRITASVAAGASPMSYQWNFGDGSAPVTGGPVVNHTYAALGSYVVSVTATNAAGSASTQTTTVVQTPVPSFALRYNTGGPSVTTNGVLWKTDAGLFTPTNSPNEQRNPGDIANTTDDALYRDYRGKANNATKTVVFEIPLNSQIGVPAGTEVAVDLRLHFAEIYWGSRSSNAEGGAGKRVFDVSVEGVLMLDNFDITIAAGAADTAVMMPINGIKVTDGKLTLTLTAVQDFAAISAFEIVNSPKAPLENVAPTAEAGADQTVAFGELVTLTGSGSDPDGDALSFSWQQSSGPAVTLVGDGASRTFTPPSAGSYSFTLTATDPGQRNGSDSVSLVVTEPLPVNQPPTVDVGADQAALVGSLITLTGSGSDPNGDALSFSWQQTSGPAVTLVGDGTSRTFTATSAGSYIFTFVAADPAGLSAADSVVVSITETEPPPGNLAPTVHAGIDQTALVGTGITLTGNGSDPDGDMLNYSWQQSSGPAVTLAGDGTSRTFTATSAGSYIFTFVATDPAGLSAADTIVISIIDVAPPDNQAPTASAGPDLTAMVGDIHTLNGLGSSDPEDGALTYNWQQIAGPTVTLNSNTAAQPTFTAPNQPTVLIFQLVVTDNFGLASVADEVNVLVNNTPAGGPDSFNVFLPLVIKNGG